MIHNHRTFITTTKRQSNDNGQDLTIIIPTAGVGHRMKFIGSKSLIELHNGITLLEQQLNTIYHLYPKAEVIITIGFQAQKIRNLFLHKYPVRFVYNKDYEINNTVHSIGLAVYNSTCSRFLLIYGDVLFNSECISGIVGDKSTILVNSTSQLHNNIVGVIEDNGIVTQLSFEMMKKWCQIAFLTNVEASMFTKTVMNDDNYKWFGYEVLNHIANNNGILHTYEPANMQIKIMDTVQDISQVSRRE